MAQITPQQAFNGTNTFYAKKWQQNGFYPIDKFVWNEEKKSFEQFVQKESGWYSLGCAFATPMVTNMETKEVITNRNWWVYIFTHAKYILSDEEMKDNNNFNLE